MVRPSRVIKSVHFFKKRSSGPSSPALPPSLYLSLLYSFFTPNFIVFFISLKKWVCGGGWGIVQADSIRLCDWVAGIPWGHAKVKEFSGTNMIMALLHLITSMVCHGKAVPLSSSAPGPPSWPGPARPILARPSPRV